MRYLTITLATALVLAVIYFSMAFALVPAPIAAEYWVREMIVIKKALAKNLAGRRKLIVSGGSSALFSVDTQQLGDELNVPAFNLGLHAGLPLKRILEVTESVAEPGDAVILLLESPLFNREEPSNWYARAALSWKYEDWQAFSARDRLKSVAILAPFIPLELAEARVRHALFPHSIADRLRALNDEQTLAAFANSPEPTQFAYSAYHLDSLGNMRKAEGLRFFDPPRFSPETGIDISPEVRVILGEFTKAMAAKDVAIYFANTPYMEVPNLDAGRIMEAEKHLERQLLPFGPMLDTRTEVLFPRKFFFDTEMHLNSEGRVHRTRRLAEAMRREESFMARFRK